MFTKLGEESVVLRGSTSLFYIRIVQLYHFRQSYYVYKNLENMFYFFTACLSLIWINFFIYSTTFCRHYLYLIIKIFRIWILHKIGIFNCLFFFPLLVSNTPLDVLFSNRFIPHCVLPLAWQTYFHAHTRKIQSQILCF